MGLGRFEFELQLDRELREAGLRSTTVFDLPPLWVAGYHEAGVSAREAALEIAERLQIGTEPAGQPSTDQATLF